jgi:hypothetical protein
MNIVKPFFLALSMILVDVCCNIPLTVFELIKIIVYAALTYWFINYISSILPDNPLFATMRKATLFVLTPIFCLAVIGMSFVLHLPWINTIALVVAFLGTMFLFY